ncbi:MAG: hypothetical protein ACPL4H_01875, partial [Anaerolineales bacterium]
PAIVIAMERSLRRKQSPTWQGDCFAALAMTPRDCHCEGAFAATEAIPKLKRRLLRYARNDKRRVGDCFATLEIASLRSQ